MSVVSCCKAAVAMRGQHSKMSAQTVCHLAHQPVLGPGGLRSACSASRLHKCSAHTVQMAGVAHRQPDDCSRRVQPIVPFVTRAKALSSVGKASTNTLRLGQSRQQSSQKRHSSRRNTVSSAATPKTQPERLFLATSAAIAARTLLKILIIPIFLCPYLLVLCDVSQYPLSVIVQRIFVVSLCHFAFLCFTILAMAMAKFLIKTRSERTSRNREEQSNKAATVLTGRQLARIQDKHMPATPAQLLLSDVSSASASEAAQELVGTCTVPQQLLQQFTVPSKLDASTKQTALQNLVLAVAGQRLAARFLAKLDQYNKTDAETNVSRYYDSVCALVLKAQGQQQVVGVLSCYFDSLCKA